MADERRPGIPFLAMRSTEGFGAGFRDTNRALFASQSGLRLSQSMCSQATQESFDFCTPVDQPVERTAVVPESPSPAKKRTRRALAGGSQVEELAQEFHDTGVTPSPRFRIRSRLTPDVREPETGGDARGGGARQQPVPAPQTPCLVPRGYQKNPFLAVVSATPDAQQRILSPALRHETAFQRMQAPAAAKRHRTKLSFTTAQSPLEGPPPRLMQDFIELKTLGRGAFFEVVLCRSRIDGCIYAVKKGIRSFHGEMDRLRAFREAQALAAAGPSQLLVACHGAWMEGELYYAKMEFCAGGSLGAALRKGMTAEAAPFSAAEAGTASDLQPTPMRQRPHVSRVAELAGADPVRGRLFGGPADLPGPTPTESPTARGPGQAASAHALGIVEPAVLTVVAQTALALHHLHTRGIAHLDVKPDNILLEDDLPPSVWRMDGASPGSAEATPSPPSRFGAAHDAASPLAAPMPAIGLSPQPPAPGSGATTPMGASSPGAPFTHGTLPPTDSAGRRAHGHLGTAALPRIRIKLGDLGQAASLDGTIDREEGDGRYMPRGFIEEDDQCDLRRVDVYSLGVSAVEMFLGDALTADCETLRTIRDGLLPVSLRRHASPGMCDLLHRMTEPSGEGRPTALQVAARAIQLCRGSDPRWWAAVERDLRCVEGAEEAEVNDVEHDLRMRLAAMEASGGGRRC